MSFISEIWAKKDVNPSMPHPQLKIPLQAGLNYLKRPINTHH